MTTQRWILKRQVNISFKLQNCVNYVLNVHARADWMDIKQLKSLLKLKCTLHWRIKSRKKLRKLQGIGLFWRLSELLGSRPKRLISGKFHIRITFHWALKRFETWRGEEIEGQEINLKGFPFQKNAILSRRIRCSGGFNFIRD